MLSLSPDDRQAIWLTLDVAVHAVGFSLPLAVLVAGVLPQTRFYGHGLVNAAVQPTVLGQ
ncbi:hypothetical protein [Acidisphaera sp. L21]|uniref:hypothetical protein n=1 Tax=Acidisphaera sp. L21 TaxID=1641851 RepID=UPI00131CA0D3|nr:hypothetical protein [Acidisphaera sp. L21]